MTTAGSPGSKDPYLDTVSGVMPGAKVVQDQYLEAVRQGQEAFVNAVQTWSQNVQRMLGDAVPADRDRGVQAEQVVDNVFAFAEQLLAAQRDFAKKLLQATAQTQEGGGQTTRAPGA
jgi:hypothetical protein